jgi:hypothetical protein
MLRSPVMQHSNWHFLFDPQECLPLYPPKSLFVSMGNNLHPYRPGGVTALLLLDFVFLIMEYRIFGNQNPRLDNTPDTDGLMQE